MCLSNDLSLNCWGFSTYLLWYPLCEMYSYWAALINCWPLFPTFLFYCDKIHSRRAPNKRTKWLYLPWYWRMPVFTQARQCISVLIFNTVISHSVKFGAICNLHKTQLVIFWLSLNLSHGQTDGRTRDIYACPVNLHDIQKFILVVGDILIFSKYFSVLLFAWRGKWMKTIRWRQLDT